MSTVTFSLFAIGLGLAKHNTSKSKHSRDCPAFISDSPVGMNKCALQSKSWKQLLRKAQKARRRILKLLRGAGNTARWQYGSLVFLQCSLETSRLMGAGGTDGALLCPILRGHILTSRCRAESVYMHLDTYILPSACLLIHPRYCLDSTQISPMKGDNK